MKVDAGLFGLFGRVGRFDRFGLFSRSDRSDRSGNHSQDSRLPLGHLGHHGRYMLALHLPVRVIGVMQDRLLPFCRISYRLEPSVWDLVRWCAR